MQQVEQTTLRSILGDHEVVVILVETDTHVEDDVWVSHLVHNLDLLNEVCDALFACALLLKPFDCYGGAHPLSLEHLSVAATSQEIEFGVELERIAVYVEVEATSVEGLNKPIVLATFKATLRVNGLVKAEQLVY